VNQNAAFGNGGRFLSGQEISFWLALILTFSPREKEQLLSSPVSRETLRQIQRDMKIVGSR